MKQSGQLRGEREKRRMSVLPIRCKGPPDIPPNSMLELPKSRHKVVLLFSVLIC